MIRKLHVSQFRGYSDFRMERLGSINLLVGGNNSGKTSLLEAIELLLAHGDPRSLWNALSRRGERVWDDEDRRGAAELDICRLFHNYDLQIGSSLEIRASDDFDEQLLRATLLEKLVETPEQDWRQAQLPTFPQEPPFGGTALSLQWKGGSNEEEETLLPLTDRGGLSFDGIRRRPPRREDQRQPVSFVTTSSLSSEEVVLLLSRYVLNPEEEVLLKALRIIEKDIERIAPVAGTQSLPGYGGQNSTRGGVVIKCRNVKTRLPIGTMGDGIWRLLSLALSLIRAEHGVLLVDEIDTGLHYTVMEDMWRLVYLTARRLGVQIFATTHSSDCWKALAAICRDPNIGADATIQHIERGKSQSTSFAGREIIIAAERGFEVR